MIYEELLDQCNEYLEKIAQKDAEIEQLKKENTELKVKVGLSIDCEKAQKSGELCLGYGCDEDEPCEECKNCIKCEGGYYQLGETDKDEHLSKAKEIIERLVEGIRIISDPKIYMTDVDTFVSEAEQFLEEN